MTTRKKAPKTAKAPYNTVRTPLIGPSLEQIRLRAYELYIGRGRTDGQDLEDWFQAEKELTESNRTRPLA